MTTVAIPRTTGSTLISETLHNIQGFGRQMTQTPSLLPTDEGTKRRKVDNVTRKFTTAPSPIYNNLMKYILKTQRETTNELKPQMFDQLNEENIEYVLSQMSRYEKMTSPMFGFHSMDGLSGLDNMEAAYDIMTLAYFLKPIATDSIFGLVLKPSDYETDIYRLVHTIGFVLENSLYASSPLHQQIMDALSTFLVMHNNNFQFPSYQRLFIDYAFIYLKSILSVSFKFSADQFYIPRQGNSIDVIFYRTLTTYTLMYKFESSDVEKFMEMIPDVHIQLDLYDIHMSNYIIPVDATDEGSEDHLYHVMKTTLLALSLMNIRPLVRNYVELLTSWYAHSTDTVNIYDVLDEMLYYTGKYMTDMHRLIEFFEKPNHMVLES